jgi:hypothetical protein
MAVLVRGSRRSIERQLSTHCGISCNFQDKTSRISLSRRRSRETPADCHTFSFDRVHRNVTARAPLSVTFMRVSLLGKRPLSAAGLLRR